MQECRPWSEAPFCGIWSGSALFDNYPFEGFSTKMHYYQGSLTLTIIVLKSPFHYLFICLINAEWMVDSIDPDEMLHSAAFDMGQNC